MAPHNVNRRHLRKAKSLSTQDRRWGRAHQGFIRHNAKVVQRGKKTLVFTFPGSLLRRILELGAAPSLRMPRFWQMSAGSEAHSFSLTPLRHTLHMEKPRFGTNGDIVNMSVESPTA